MRNFWKPTRHQRAHAMTEMALTLPILLMVIMGIMDFGRAFFIYSQVSNAAREGARWGSVTGVVPQGQLEQWQDCDAIREAVVDKFGLALDIEPGDIIIEYDDGATLLPYNCNGTSGPAADQMSQGDRIRVTVSTEFQFLTPIISSFLTEVPLSFTAARSIFRGGVTAEPPIG